MSTQPGTAPSDDSDGRKMLRGFIVVLALVETVILAATLTLDLVGGGTAAIAAIPAMIVFLGVLPALVLAIMRRRFRDRRCSSKRLPHLGHARQAHLDRPDCGGAVASVASAKGAGWRPHRLAGTDGEPLAPDIIRAVVDAA